MPLFGIGPAYVAIACFYALGLLLTFRVDNIRRKPSGGAVHIDCPAPSAWRDLRDGIAHVWSSTPLLAAVLLALLVNLTAFPFSNGLLPYVVREIYHLDQTALGYLAALLVRRTLRLDHRQPARECKPGTHHARCCRGLAPVPAGVRPHARTSTAASSR